MNCATLNFIKIVCNLLNISSSYNVDEVNMVMEFIQMLLSEDKYKITQSDIGVVSPYKLQCKKIQENCDKRNFKEVTIGTAEVFQGQERKVMIMSTVRAGKKKSLGNFLSNAQVRCCVQLINFH